jgi:hypothetical protein
VSNGNLTGRLSVQLGDGKWKGPDGSIPIDQAYDLYNRTRATYNLQPTFRLSSSLAIPFKASGNEKLQKTADKMLRVVGGRTLAQGTLSGINVCPWATPACLAGCLGTTGHLNRPRNIRVREARTRFEFDHPRHAWTLYNHEIERDTLRALKLDMRLFWRPDILSDSAIWRNVPWLFDRHPQVTFYGYTKNEYGIQHYSKGGWFAPNYRLAVSASERWDPPAFERAANAGMAIATVFRIKSAEELPTEFLGIPVVDAISTDTWMIDNPGTVIGGLRALGKMWTDHTGFVHDVPTNKEKT